MIDLDTTEFGTVLLSPYGRHFALDDGDGDELGLFAWLTPVDADGRPTGQRRQRLYYDNADGWIIPGRPETVPSDDGPGAALAGAIADELHALAELVRTSPRLAEELRHSLTNIPVRVLGLNPPGAIGAICTDAQRRGLAVDRQVRATGTRADIICGRHVKVWLYTSHDTLPAGATS